MRRKAVSPRDDSPTFTLRLLVLTAGAMALVAPMFSFGHARAATIVAPERAAQRAESVRAFALGDFGGAAGLWRVIETALDAARARASLSATEAEFLKRDWFERAYALLAGPRAAPPAPALGERARVRLGDYLAIAGLEAGLDATARAWLAAALDLAPSVTAP